MSGDPRDGTPPADERGGGASATPQGLAHRALTGASGFVAKHRTGVFAGALTAVFLLLAAGSLSAGIATASSGPAPTRTPSASTAPTARPTPGALPDAVRVRTCSAATALGADGLPALRASVLSGTDGTTLLSRHPATGFAPGSLAGITTAAAALAVLGPDFRLETDVVDTGSGVALVGGGDPTLSATPAGQESVYAGAPKLADLATATVAAWATAHPGQQITGIVLDATDWSASDGWDADWDPALRTGGVLGPVTALQVDGGRADPTQLVSPRGDDPVTAAGTAFVAALHAADPTGAIVPASPTVTIATAPTTGAKLAGAQSQPLSTLIGQLLATGDATLAEALARVTSVEAGGRGTSASVPAVMDQALAEYGVDTDDLVLDDGSGSSPADRLTTSYLASLLQLVAGGQQNLDVVRDALGAAGSSGTLATRFAGASARARGHVTGVASAPAGGSAMTGIVTLKDGTTLAFAVSAAGDGVAPAAVDALVAAMYRCGDNLADH